MTKRMPNLAIAAACMFVIAAVALSTARSQQQQQQQQPTPEEPQRHCPEEFLWEWNGIYYYTLILCPDMIPLAAIATLEQYCGVGCDSECCDDVTLQVNSESRPRLRQPVTMETRIKTASKFTIYNKLEDQVVQAPGGRSFRVAMLSAKVPNYKLVNGEYILDGTRSREFLLGQEMAATPMSDASGTLDGDQLEMLDGKWMGKKALVLFR